MARISEIIRELEDLQDEYGDIELRKHTSGGDTIAVPTDIEVENPDGEEKYAWV